jgi:hypothetical protein
VPESERLVNQIIDTNAGEAQTGSNQTAPISELIRVTSPTTIRLQAQRIDAAGTATVGHVYSDVHGYTSSATSGSATDAVIPSRETRGPCSGQSAAGATHFFRSSETVC